MKIVKALADNKKVLLLVLVLQLVIYWLCLLGMETKSQFIAYQQF